jgi:hypothetical protein
MPRVAAARRSETRRRITVGDTAWLAVVPATVLMLLAIVVVGPWIGNGIFAPGEVRFWPLFVSQVNPEPIEHGRFAVALTAPLVLSALTIVGVRRWSRREASSTVDALVVGIQLLAVAFVVLCFLQQVHEILGPLYAGSDEQTPDIRLTFYNAKTLLVAALVTAGMLAALGSMRARERLTSWTAETRHRGIVVGVLAVLVTIVWVMPGLYTEHTVAGANPQVFYHVAFPLDEAFAVLDGRTPMVDFTAQYGSLWAFASAGGMWIFGETVGVWVTLALIATSLGMLAIFAVLRRAAGSSVRGLLLFLPVLATSFFLVQGPRETRYTYGNYFGTFPIRYAGPSVLAWLLARHLGAERPRQAWALFLFAGFVALNNADAGIPALGATVAALLWTGGRPTRRGLGRLALEAAAGLLGAFVLVSLLTLVRAGDLPDPDVMLRFSRLFGLAGFGAFAMPVIGLHTVVYVTFVAAIGVATARALRAAPDRLLTGMLAWSGVFGLGAGAYFAARSSPENLVAVFFPWSFALALLLVPVVRSLGVAWWRQRPAVGAVFCVFGFLVMACSLAQLPTPWEQLDRLQHRRAALYAQPLGQSFVAKHTNRGDAAVVLVTLGHRIGVNLGIDDVSPYAEAYSIPARAQLDDVIAALRAAGGRKLFIDGTRVDSAMLAALHRRGFASGPIERRTGTVMLTDTEG